MDAAPPWSSRAACWGAARLWSADFLPGALGARARLGFGSKMEKFRLRQFQPCLISSRGQRGVVAEIPRLRDRLMAAFLKPSSNPADTIYWSGFAQGGRALDDAQVARGGQNAREIRGAARTPKIRRKDASWNARGNRPRTD